MIPKLEDTWPRVKFEDWSTIDYKVAWDKQIHIHQTMLDFKRNWAGDPNGYKIGQLNTLVFCDHDHVFTLGKSGAAEHLRVNEGELEAIGATYYKINRGGDITYHGPGQIVGYYLFDLDCFKNDVHWFVRSMEEAIIVLLAKYGIKGMRIKEYTGVWIDNQDGTYSKICAIGVHLSRWISMHGFAFNVSPDLNYFDHIIPCGIVDDNKKVTSMQKILKNINLEEVKRELKEIIAQTFQFQYVI